MAQGKLLNFEKHHRRNQLLAILIRAAWGRQYRYHGIRTKRSSVSSMADFKTHITGSAILGTIYGVGANLQYGVPPAQCMVAGALCTVAGMLPDLDSKSGIPQREMLSFVSVLIPMLMVFRFQEMGLTAEHLVFAAGVLYVILRFGVGNLFKKYTKHRGMWHSIPAAVTATLFTYIICLSGEEHIRMFKAWGVFMGFVLHLLLDEFYSVDLMGRRLKKSFGTAMKFFGNNRVANVFAYANILVLALMIANDRHITDCCKSGLQYVSGASKEEHDKDLVDVEQPRPIPENNGRQSAVEHLEEAAGQWIKGAFETTPPRESWR